jgi:ADP-ribose pyrophosphatase YjhB (NUDIX family)
MSGQKTTLIVRLILERDDEILFLKKTSQNGGGYSLVGGKVEQAESANKAIIRESLEEANIHIKRKHLRLVHIFKREFERELILLYSAKKWEGKLESRELEKFKKVVWIKKDKLPDHISEVTRHMVEAYNQEMFFSEEFITWIEKEK